MERSLQELKRELKGLVDDMAADPLFNAIAGGEESDFAGLQGEINEAMHEIDEGIVDD